MVDHWERLTRLIEEIEASPLTGRAALIRYMERAAEQVAPDRAFFEAAHTAGIDDPEMHATAGALDVAIARLLAAAQRDGAVRDDIVANDIQMLVSAATITCAPFRDVVPDLWRRYLALMIAGLGGSSELPVAALEHEDYPALMDEVRRRRGMTE